MIEQKSLKTLEYSKVLECVSKYAYSSCAKNLILSLQPTCDYNQVESLLKQTQQADKIMYEHGISPSFAIDDVTEVLNAAEKFSTLSISDIMSIGTLLRVSRAAKGMIENINDNQLEDIKLISSRLHFNKNLEDNIANSFISSTEVSDNASATLKEIRRAIKNCNSKIKQKLNGFISDGNYSTYLQDNLITVRNNRFVVPLKSDCRGKISGLVHDQSATGSTLFVEPMVVVELNNELRQHELDEQKEIQVILSKFSTEIANEHYALSQSFQAVVELDSIFAKAAYAKSIKAVCPQINANGIVDIIEGRHPLIDKNKVVAVSVNLGKTFNTLVITGPNTGGKTVTLKLVGIICLMTMTGLFIPAHYNSNIAIFDSIFCDIGDEQSIEQSLSTFSSHLTNIVHITNSLSNNSLILLDELGVGTDPVEGSALAISVIDYFNNHNCRTITTSHFNELKEYSYVTQGVCNASMDFNPQTFSPTYKLLIGISGSSNALEIAKNLGLKNEIVNNAKSKISQEKLSFDKIIASAENSRRTAEQLKEQANLKLTQINEQLSQVEQLKSDLLLKQEKLDNKLTKGFKNLLDDYSQEAQELIEQIKAKVDEGDKQALFEARTLNKKLENMTPNNQVNKEFEKLEGEIIVGDSVFVKSLNSIAKVIQLKPQKNESVVKAGVLTCTVKNSDLQKIKHESAKVDQPKATVTRQFSNVACPRELNVLGQNCDEAIFNIELYISQAILQGYEEVRIVHGKGTGALRKGLHAYFATNKNIESFRLGNFGEGDNGVTVLKLK